MPMLYHLFFHTCVYKLVMNKSWYRARKTAAEELPGKHARIEATNAGETAASAVSSKETCGVFVEENNLSSVQNPYLCILLY